MADLIIELIQEVATQFKAHIEAEGNKKILFSGKYGKGKTTFLETFFSQQQQYAGGEKYRYYYLDPVNYTVASNEDIFQYIKYDILLELIRYETKFDDIEFDIEDAGNYFLWQNPEKLIKSILYFIPKV